MDIRGGASGYSLYAIACAALQRIKADSPDEFRELRTRAQVRASAAGPSPRARSQPLTAARRSRRKRKSPGTPILAS